MLKVMIWSCVTCCQGEATSAVMIKQLYKIEIIRPGIVSCILVNLLILFDFQVMRIDVTSVTSPVEAARGLIDTAYRVYYTPTNTNHLLVTTENSRLLKFDAPTGKLIAEVRLSLLPNTRKI